MHLTTQNQSRTSSHYGAKFRGNTELRPGSGRRAEHGRMQCSGKPGHFHHLLGANFSGVVAVLALRELRPRTSGRNECRASGRSMSSLRRWYAALRLAARAVPPPLRRYGSQVRAVPPPLRRYGSQARAVPPPLRRYGSQARAVPPPLRRYGSQREPFHLLCGATCRSATSSTTFSGLRLTSGSRSIKVVPGRSQARETRRLGDRNVAPPALREFPV